MIGLLLNLAFSIFIIVIVILTWTNTNKLVKHESFIAGEAAPPTPPGTGDNPLKGLNFYVQPSLATNINNTIHLFGVKDKTKLNEIAGQPSALWIDTIERIMDSTSKNHMVMVIVQKQH